MLRSQAVQYVANRTRWPLYKTMNITLELYDDPNGSDEPINVKSNMWVMRVNGQDFPNRNYSLVTLEKAKTLTECLMKTQEIVKEYEGDLWK